MPETLKIAVLASGRGSNLRAILDAITAGRIPNAQVVVVISDNSDAGALALARARAIPAVHIHPKQFPSADAYNRQLLETLRRYETNFIAMAGYLRKLDPMIVHAYSNRIVNIHPALLPDFGGPGMYGLRVHQAVLASGASVSGATVHLVDEEYDRGPIVAQERCEVRPDDTADTLAARVLGIEHRLYPETIRLFAEGRVQIDGQHVLIGQ